MSVLTSFMQGDFKNGILRLGVTIFVVFCILPIHEYAHALIADKLGDGTARLSGRMTINPMAHLDIWGSLMIILVGFGYAKPVPINMNNFKNPKKGMAVVALAGPVSNLIMAIIFILLSIIFQLIISVGTELGYAINLFLSYVAMININLALFNLIPIPPLDGSRILNAVLPDRAYYKLMQYERYIMIGLFLLMVMPRFNFIWSGLSWLSSAVYTGLFNLLALPFKAFI